MTNDLLLNNFLTGVAFVPVHIRNLQTLFIDTYKVVNGSSPLIINEIFKSCDEGRCNVWDQNTFNLSLVNVLYNGTEITSFLEPLRIK